MPEMQREIVVDAYLAGRNPAEIAARRGIRVQADDNHLQAAFRSLRDSMEDVVDISTDIDLPDWYDRVAEMNKRHAARQRRRAARKKENRSSSGGDRSNFEDDWSNSRGDADENARAPDYSVELTTES